MAEPGRLPHHYLIREPRIPARHRHRGPPSAARQV